MDRRLLAISRVEFVALSHFYCDAEMLHTATAII